AEDGIRDFHVTGVQTCALPILVNNKKTSEILLNSNLYTFIRHLVFILKKIIFIVSQKTEYLLWLFYSFHHAHKRTGGTPRPPLRSEERRVGKEYRSRW